MSRRNNYVSTFNPNKFDGLVFWLNPILESSLTYDASNFVSSFVEQSDNQRTITQATSSLQAKWQNNKEFYFSSDEYDITSMLTDVATTSTGTICGWFKPDNTSQFMTLYAAGENARDSFIRVYMGNTGKIAFNSRRNSVEQYWIESTNNEFTAGVWTHWAIVQDGTGIKMYIDGSAVATTTTISSGGISYWYDEDLSLDVVKLAVLTRNGVDAIYAFGSYGEFLIYDNALSASEIQTIYNSRSTNYS